MTQPGAPQVTTAAPDLDEAARYIAFEMFHLRYYAGVFEHSPPERRFRSALGERIGQAFEYCLLLHLRVLLDFFHKEPNPKKDKDDVWVGHFEVLEGFQRAYPKVLYSPAEDIKPIRDHLHKWLAHFTSTRWTARQLHLGIESYRRYWTDLLVLIDKFESALTGTPKVRFDGRMQALRDTCDLEDHVRPPTASG